MFINCLDSEEISEAQRTNKPSGKCQYCLMISKTCQEAKKSIPARGPATKMPIFVNAEEEFFYEVQTNNIPFISITFVNMNISVHHYSYGSNGLFFFASITASCGEVSLLGPGGSWFMSLRTMVVRWCTYETLPDSVSDPHGENASNYGQAEGLSHNLNTSQHTSSSALHVQVFHFPVTHQKLRDYCVDTVRVDTYKCSVSR